ncbi:hypothetical protein ACQEU8_11000 [Streptomyces sp. CA-250714]|uniref:hypothetical protein n=1 Tax=Streptomyces sp. CA-250714 TaxID=3240060 RepID=UPI003D8D8E7A
MREEDPNEQDSRLAAAVRLTRVLHDADWGDWSLEAVRSLAAGCPDGRVDEPGALDVVVRLGGGLGPVVLSTQKHGPEADRYQKAEAPLPAALWQQPAAFDALVDALRGIGTPALHRGTAGRPTLRWRDGNRVLILQRNSRRVWLAVHPAATAGRDVPSAVLTAAAEVAAEVHDIGSGQWRPEDLGVLAARENWQLLPEAEDRSARLLFHGADSSAGGSPVELPVGDSFVQLFRHAPDASLPQRRAAFSAFFDALVGSIGEPTLYGGSASGPDVRWRTTERLLTLRGDSRRIWLEGHSTQDEEDDEYRIFKWGGAWHADEPSDFAVLPYVWQLDRQGPGDNPEIWPGGRLAMSVERLRESLELLLAAWIEQLPAQVGAYWAGFVIVNCCDGGRELLVSFDADTGLSLSIDVRDVPKDEESQEAVAAMRERGWQHRNRFRWRAEFPAPDRHAASAAARLIAADLAARGAKVPEDDLRVRDVSCFDHGSFDLFGLGIPR